MVLSYGYFIEIFFFIFSFRLFILIPHSIFYSPIHSRDTYIYNAHTLHSMHVILTYYRPVCLHVDVQSPFFVLFSSLSFTLLTHIHFCLLPSVLIPIHTVVTFPNSCVLAHSLYTGPSLHIHIHYTTPFMRL